MRVPLKIQGVTDVNSENMFSLLIVTDIKEERQMAIMVDPSMRHEFALRRGKYVGNDVQRKNATEMLSLMLPETLCSIIKYMTQLELSVIIVNIFDGEYKAILEDQKTGTTFPIRISDGILLAYADPHIPLYIEETLWKNQSTKYMGENARGISLPLNTLTTEMLKDAMQKCIDDEKYEIAEQLKKELERRGA